MQTHLLSLQLYQLQQDIKQQEDSMEENRVQITENKALEKVTLQFIAFTLFTLHDNLVMIYLVCGRRNRGDQEGIGCDEQTVLCIG